jgi:hypothetical protein
MGFESGNRRHSGSLSPYQQFEQTSDMVLTTNSDVSGEASLLSSFLSRHPRCVEGSREDPAKVHDEERFRSAAMEIASSMPASGSAHNPSNENREEAELCAVSR